MEYVNTASLVNEDMFHSFLALEDLESQKEWIQATKEIEAQLEQKYSITKYQKVEQHWMTILFVLNYLIDLLPFQFQGEVVHSLLTQRSTKQKHWMLELWVTPQWANAVAASIINALENTTTFISLIWQGKITVKYLGTDPFISSLDLETATPFHDYTYQLRSSSLDMSAVTWDYTIISWSEFLLLDGVDFFPSLKHFKGNTLLNILPSSAELVSKYLSNDQDSITSALDVINDHNCSDATAAKPAQMEEPTTALDSSSLPEIDLNVEIFAELFSSPTKTTTKTAENT